MEFVKTYKVYFIIAIVMMALAAIMLLGQRETQKRVDEFISENQLQSVLEYQDVTFNPINMTPSIMGLKVQVDPNNIFTLKELTIHENHVDPENDEANIDISFSLMPTPLDQIPSSIKSLFVEAAMFGLDELAGQGRFKVNNEDGETVVFVQANLEGLGEVNFSFEGEYDRLTITDLFENFRKYSVFAFMSIDEQTANKALLLEEMQVELDVDEYLEKIIVTLRDENELTSERNQQDFKRTLQQMGLTKMDSEEANQMNSELVGFLESPSHLSITLDPDDVMSIKQMMQAFQQTKGYEVLNIDISH